MHEQPRESKRGDTDAGGAKRARFISKQAQTCNFDVFVILRYLNKKEMDPGISNSTSVAEVLKLTEPTTKFMCKLSDNIYGVKFGAFKIRDMESGFVIVDIREEDRPSDEDEKTLEGMTPEEEISVRTVRYHLGPEFLELQTIGTTVEFSVGDKEVPNFRMIERHYFKNKLLKNFDFSFGFCIPNSTNSWEVIYNMPKLNA